MSRKKQPGIGVVGKGDGFRLRLHLAGDRLPFAVLDVEQLRKFTTLEDGDLVMTGTPEGVGAIHKGERFDGRILAGDNVLVSASWVAQ